AAGARAVRHRNGPRGGATSGQSMSNVGFPPLPLSPAMRPRRLRRADFSRRMVREPRRGPDDLTSPVYFHAGTKQRADVPSMPGVERLSVDLLLPVAEQCLALGVPVIALFPAIDPGIKTPDGRIAADPEGLVPRAVAALKQRFPDLG